MSEPDGLRKLAIVPAYNEGGMVARVVRDIRRSAPDFDVLVVDDGSTDSTAAEAKAAGATVLTHPFNLGIGGAMQSGYKYALRGGYDVAVQVDGDGQHKPSYLNDMVAALNVDGQADMVYGSRFRGDPGYKVPLGRRLGNLIFSVVLTAITRQKITDPTSGFRMTNRHGIELFARDYPHDYPEVEAILMLHAHHLRIHEVPVRMNARGFGRSSIDYPRSAYYMAKVLLALFVGLFRRRPTPMTDEPDTPEGEAVAPGAAVSGADAPRGGRDVTFPATLLPLAADGLDGRLQIVAVVVTALMFLAVLELVRRRYLAERYALLWMIVAGGLLVLAIWTDLLTWGTELLNIEVPANGLFLAAFAVAFLLLLHFSVATSRLSEQTKILAQEVARLDGELRAAAPTGRTPTAQPRPRPRMASATRQ